MASFMNTSSLVKPKDAVPTQTVTGFPISASSFDGQVNAIMNWAKCRLSRVVCVANVHMLMEGHWHRVFADVLMKADMLTPDGMPLVWMTSLMKGKPQDRVAGMELMLALCQQAEKMGVSLFLFGSTAKTLMQIRGRLAKDFPNLRVVGLVSPPFRPLDEAENEAIAAQINQSGAGLVFVSLGCPKQETWMSAHSGRIKAVMIGLGGVFPIYAGNEQWAPSWMRQHGLEWCYRLKQDPRRLWRRYASTIPPFVWLALKQIVKVRLGLDPDHSFKRQRIRNN